MNLNTEISDDAENDVLPDMKVAAVVIWYNPQLEFVENIKTYLGSVQKLVVVDNSATDNSGLLAGLLDVEYIALLENKGIAAALNVGVAKAADMGADWVLTMDQDSWFDTADFQQFLNPDADHFKLKKVAIFCPKTDGRTSSAEPIDLIKTITSGNLLRVKAWLDVGGFNEELFIDGVDHEICYRVKRRGLRVVCVQSVFMHHTIGAPKYKVIFGKRVRSRNHPAARKYYIARNRFYLQKHFPEFCRLAGPKTLEQIAKILFLEDQKWLKIRSVFLGIWHYKTGQMGPLR